MGYEVSEESRNKTRVCSNDYRCVNNEHWEPCTIDSSLREVLVVKDRCNRDHCEYSILLGFSYYFCKCPLRQEIYRLYNK
jgi:hypothetical protein